jgi:signal transduction histidine kinase
MIEKNLLNTPLCEPYLAADTHTVRLKKQVLAAGIFLGLIILAELCIPLLDNYSLARWIVMLLKIVALTLGITIGWTFFTQRPFKKRAVIHPRMNDITTEILLQKRLEEEKRIHQNELAQAISNTQESERKNMSEELHDNVCQVLGGVKLYIEHCIKSPEKNNELLKQSATHLNNVIDELRKMAHCLSPYVVEEFGLLSGIRDLVYFATNFRNTQVHLDIGQFDENILSGPQKLLLYRIVQEQLNNIYKHAQATQIVIELRHEDNTCHFIIKDNGIGTQLDEKKEGLGLKNIRNRVKLLNGQVRFISAPGNGFWMQVEF